MNSLKEMLPTILDKSREGKLDWEDYGEATFGANLGNLVITTDKKVVRTIGSPKSVIRYVLTLRSSSGSVIDQVSGSSDPILENLRDIHESARRQAFQVEESLTELKDILGKL